MRSDERTIDQGMLIDQVWLMWAGLALRRLRFAPLTLRWSKPLCRAALRPGCR